MLQELQDRRTWEQDNNRPMAAGCTAACNNNNTAG